MDFSETKEDVTQSDGMASEQFTTEQTSLNQASLKIESSSNVTETYRFQMNKVASAHSRKPSSQNPKSVRFQVDKAKWMKTEKVIPFRT